MPPRTPPAPPDSSVVPSGTCPANASPLVVLPGFLHPPSERKPVIPSSPDRSQYAPWLVSFSACALSAFSVEPRFTASSCGRRPATSSTLSCHQRERSGVFLLRGPRGALLPVRSQDAS